MNPRYMETYRQQRLLFLVPILIAMTVALWSNAGRPTFYRSATSLWSDTAGGSANDLSGAPPPAAQEQTTLNELLRTQYFRTRVARRGPLEAYLKKHSLEGWGPGALISKLRGPTTLDDRIATALSVKRVTSEVLGPHVLKISYDGPTAEISYATLKVLIKEFEGQRSTLRADALTSYRDAISSASKTLAETRTQIQTYVREHPGISASDLQMRALQHEERNALDQVSGATAGLTQAANDALGSSQATLRIVDPPEIPLAPYSTRRKSVFGLIAGLFVGALVSILGIFALTKTGRTAPSVDVEVVRPGPRSGKGEPWPQREGSETPVADARAAGRVHAQRRPSFD